MAGRLVIPKVILGSLLSLGVPCAVDCNRYLPDAHGACLQPSGATTNDAACPETNQEPKQDPNQEPNQEPREKHRDDKGLAKRVTNRQMIKGRAAIDAGVVVEAVAIDFCSKPSGGTEVRSSSCHY